MNRWPNDFLLSSIGYLKEGMKSIRLTKIKTHVFYQMVLQGYKRYAAFLIEKNWMDKDIIHRGVPTTTLLRIEFQPLLHRSI